MARDEILAQTPDRRQVVDEVRLERTLGESDELFAVREAVLEQRDLRVHRELVEGEYLFLHAFDLRDRQAARARLLQELAVERRALGAPALVQIEKHAPG